MEALSLTLFFIAEKSTRFYNNRDGGIELNNRLVVITNNELVREKYSKSMDITFVDGQYIDVLRLVRDMVHKGCRIISHPLMGSIKPNETPYRSIIVEKDTPLDVNSLTIIENSIASYEKFTSYSKPVQWEENTLEDFRFVDLKLIESALDSINS